MVRNKRSKPLSIACLLTPDEKILKTWACPLPREFRLHIHVQKQRALVILVWRHPPEKEKMGTFLGSLDLYQSPSIVTEFQKRDNKM